MKFALLKKKITKSICLFYHTWIKTHPFKLVKYEPRDWFFCNKIIPPLPALPVTQREPPHQAYLYPSGLLIWFFLLPALPVAVIIIFWLMGGCLNWVDIFGLGLYTIITIAVPFLIYRVFNEPVLSALWLKWPHSYADLVNDFFLAGKPITLLSQSVRQRNKVVISVAMKSLLELPRFFLYWLTPVWLSFLGLLILLVFSYFNILSNNSESVLSPKSLFLSIIVWWLLSLLFTYKQKKYIQPQYWHFNAKDIDRFPPSTHDYLRLERKSKEPEIVLTKIINFVQISAFGIYMVLLLFISPIFLTITST